MFLLIIGLVVLGPEKLPDAIRRVGRLYAELKRMSSGVQKDLRQVMDEPIKEFMKTANTAKSLFTDTTNELHAAAKEIVEPKFIPYEASVPSASDESTADESTATPEISKFATGYIDPDEPELKDLPESPGDNALDDPT